MGRTLAYPEKSRTFAPENRGVEQLVARWAHNPKVVCSSQASATSRRATCWMQRVARFLCAEIYLHISPPVLGGLMKSDYLCESIRPGGKAGRDAAVINVWFNPSFCQELVKREGRRGCPVFPWGTHEVPVGDKRGSRGGQTRASWGTNERLVGDKRQPLVSQSVEKAFGKEGQKTLKNEFV